MNNRGAQLQLISTIAMAAMAFAMLWIAFEFHRFNSQMKNGTVDVHIQPATFQDHMTEQLTP